MDIQFLVFCSSRTQAETLQNAITEIGLANRFSVDVVYSKNPHRSYRKELGSFFKKIIRYFLAPDKYANLIVICGSNFDSADKILRSLLVPIPDAFFEHSRFFSEFFLLSKKALTDIRFELNQNNAAFQFELQNQLVQCGQKIVFGSDIFSGRFFKQASSFFYYL